jgi:hypothetical protein
VRWYCSSCHETVDGANATVCLACGGVLTPDRRLHEPDLPAMGSEPSDHWVAVCRARPEPAASELQDVLERSGIPAMLLPGSDGLPFVAVPSRRVRAALDLLEALAA